MKKLSTKDYYDVIAGEYDALLGKDSVNADVRNKFAEYVLSNSAPCTIMDFGGGTGSDLPWLTNAGYSVVFCEPSANMRARAQELYGQLQPGLQVIFLHDKDSDFNNWDAGAFMREREINLITANFAVLNSIPNLDALFAKLSEVLKPGGRVFANVLHPRGYLSANPISLLKRRILGTPVVVPLRRGSIGSEARVYKVKDYEKASSAYFEIVNVKPLGGNKFMLIDFVRR